MPLSDIFVNLGEINLNMQHKFILFLFLLLTLRGFGQTVPPQSDPRIYDIIDSVSPDRIEADIRKLASFGTRNTFSDTTSQTRGIGAARRWIKAEFDKLSDSCSECLEVFLQKDLVTKEGNSRVPHDAWVVNVVAVQRGSKYPDNYIIMSGDIDSRASNTMDFTTDAPGANDN